MARGYKCPECGKFAGTYKKGAYHCGSCNSIWWSAFDRPSAGTPRKGYTCPTCGNLTIHPTGTVANAKVWRCSTCAVTMITPAS